MTRLAMYLVGGGSMGNADERRAECAELRWRGLALSLAALPLLGALAFSTPAFAASATRVSAFEYDATSGLLTKEIVEPDQTQFRLETLYVYDAFGNKLSATVSSPATGQAAIVSRTGSNAYDASGRFATSSTNALTHSETRSYDARFGAALSLTGPNNLATTWQYDNFGRKILETRADGTMTKREYLFCSGVNGGTATCPALAKYLVKTTPLSSTDATPLDSSDIQNGPSSKVYCDALGREIRSETQGFDGSGSSTAILKDTEYDSKGRVLRASKPYYSGQTVKWTTFTYDAIGRVITETYPDNSTTTFTYAGLVTTATNSLSQTKTTTKNSQGQVVQVKDTQNNTTSFAYDPFGNLVSTTDAAGNVTTATFDIRGRKTAMVDPDMGAWSYVYNALGELVQQTDAKAQVSTMAYDKLGRLTERAEPGLTSTWTYDSATKGIGKLASATASNGYLRTQFYDSLGRPWRSQRWIDQATLDPGYNSDTSYDTQGRVLALTYPSGFKVRYEYTALGYLQYAKNDATNALFWQADTLDAEGHLTQQTYGNAVVTNQTFDANTSHLTGITAGPTATPTSVQNMSFVWDSISNLSSRTDATQNVQENFTYDSLNRLTGSSIVDAPSLTKTIQYNAIGNITSKSDVGTYTYNASGASSVRPHAVTGVAGTVNATYTYDTNGNMTAGAGRTVTYTSFNMPATIARGAVTISFDYDSEHSRTKQVAPDGTTVYLGPSTGHHAEKLIGTTGTVRWTSYIHAGGGMVAAYYEQSGGGSGPTYAGSDNHGGQTIMGTVSTTDTVVYPRVRSYYTIITNNSSTYYGTPTGGFYYEIHQTGGGIDSALFVERAQFTDQTIDLATGQPVSATTTTYLRYFHKDHLGSISVITNEAGAVTERLSYDAWGKRRHPTGADDPSETITSSTDRGFTGHEHLEYVGLIHMNGRIYDPVLARFLTADPFIQDPTDTQSLNRYTYVLNNPLAYTDPHGFFFKKLFKAIKSVWKSTIGRAIIAIAATVTMQ